jgi:hypothetical protein
LDKNPVFLYLEDRFEKPNPFAGDIVVAIDDVIEKKIECVHALESQFFEGGCCSGITELPDTPEETAARKQEVQQGFDRRFRATANRFRDKLAQLYGEDRARNIEYAEAFEICEYGSQPTEEQIRELFPFFGSE